MGNNFTHLPTQIKRHRQKYWRLAHARENPNGGDLCL